MCKYKEVDSHVVNSESLSNKDHDAGVFNEGQILYTLDDGIKIEMCLIILQLMYTLDTVNDAIAGKRKISFIYNTYGTDFKLHPKRNMMRWSTAREPEKIEA